MKFLKKSFWIILCVLGIALVSVFVLPLIFKRKNKSTSVITDIIDKTQLEIDKVEIDAQIEIAKAKGKEESVIQDLEKLKEEKDRRKRLEMLSKLLD